MLRVGLTGDLGSGKSTVARLLGERGAVVMASDDVARALMEPGERVFEAIVERFGPGVLAPDGRLNRSELARIAFDPLRPRVEELNAIVHPAVIAEQERRIERLAGEVPESIVVVESALVFSARVPAGDSRNGEDRGSWSRRFDCIVVVTAPEEAKISRYVERMTRPESSPEEKRRWREDARRRLQVQAATGVPASEKILMLENNGSLAELLPGVAFLWAELQERERASAQAHADGGS